jgi:hypothetical protein
MSQHENSFINDEDCGKTEIMQNLEAVSIQILFNSLSTYTFLIVVEGESSRYTFKHFGKYISSVYFTSFHFF